SSKSQDLAAIAGTGTCWAMAAGAVTAASSEAAANSAARNARPALVPVARVAAITWGARTAASKERGAGEIGLGKRCIEESLWRFGSCVARLSRTGSDAGEWPPAEEAVGRPEE